MIGDAFGAALLSCYERGAQPGEVAQIIERDDGFIESNDMAVYFTPPREWPPIDRWACDRIAGRVLDVGAGVGRHSLGLQERGCDVVALDTSPGAVDVCRLRGVQHAFEGSVEELLATAPEPFDAFLLLGNNLGLLRDAAYARVLLETLAAMSRPGATLAGTCIDPYPSNHPEHLAYHDANRAAGRMAGQVRIRIRYRRLATPWWEYLFCSLDELHGLIDGTGWRIEDSMAEGVQYAVRMRLAS